MKNILLVSLFSVVTSICAQLEYSLTHSNSTYADLTSPTDVTTNAWDGEHVMRLPFTFKYFNKGYDTIHIVAVTGIFFSNVPGSSDIIFFGTKTYYPENSIKAMSPVSYQVSGTSPNRIFKVQFKNFFASTGPSEDYIVNNQIWLYETSNNIEYHFGPNQITDINENEFYIGMIDYDNSPYYAIDSSAANPVLVRVTSALTFNGIKTHPLNGQVYTLTPKILNSIQPLIHPYNFYHLANGFYFETNEEAVIGVYDMAGKLVVNPSYTRGQVLRHEFSNLSAGIYIVHICINNAQFTEKILVQ